MDRSLGETDACYPCWVNQGLDAGWWSGNDPSADYDRELFQVANDPDMGAYAGPWACEFDSIPISEGNIVDLDDHYNLIANLECIYGNRGSTNDYYRFFDGSDGYIDNHGFWTQGSDPIEGAAWIDGGSFFSIPDGMTLYSNIGFFAQSTSNNKIGFACLDDGGSWGGIHFNSRAVIDSVFLNYVVFDGADQAIYMNGLADSGNNRAQIENCEIIDSGTGVYINNSRVELKDCEITGSDDESVFGPGVYITGSSAGKVIIDGCDIHDNGTESTIVSAGITCVNSDPEIINTEIYDNSGGGISCSGSSPDLNTWDALLVEDRPNTIESNGGPTQSGSDGAEIYLSFSSYPDVNYNNIVDYDPILTIPIGYMIYKHSTNNTAAVDATYNYWGATPSSSFFYWGIGSAIDYSSYYGSELSSAEEYAAAKALWSRGEYAEAARYFRNCVADTGSIGINSVHYLTGCTGEIENGNFRALRGFFQETFDEHEDNRVAFVADRFSTHCLTELGEYEDAMEEYLDRAENAETFRDSILAMVDYLSVEELVEGNLDALTGKSTHEQISNLLAMLHNGGDDDDRATLLPKSFMVVNAYPNPFNSTTTINYNLSENIHVNMTIHDMNGRQVENLVNGVQNTGYRSVTFQADNLPSGLYFCRMEAGGVTNIQKLTLLR